MMPSAMAEPTSWRLPKESPAKSAKSPKSASPASAPDSNPMAPWIVSMMGPMTSQAPSRTLVMVSQVSSHQDVSDVEEVSESHAPVNESHTPEMICQFNSTAAEIASQAVSHPSHPETASHRSDRAEDIASQTGSMAPQAVTTASRTRVNAVPTISRNRSEV